MEKVESLLRDIGLKEYEAKAFMSICQCGICSADQVSKISNIPLTRVYETMQSLQKLGIVTVLNTRPKKYRFLSVDALSNLTVQAPFHQSDSHDVPLEIELGLVGSP